EVDVEPQPGARLAAVGGDVVERRAAIDAGLALAEHVEVGAVEDEDDVGHGRFLRNGPSIEGMIVREKSRRRFFSGQPPVTLMWRETAGRLVRRSMTKSCPLGLRPIASSMARASSSLPSELRS